MCALIGYHAKRGCSVCRLKVLNPHSWSICSKAMHIISWWRKYIKENPALFCPICLDYHGVWMKPIHHFEIICFHLDSKLVAGSGERLTYFNLLKLRQSEYSYQLKPPLPTQQLYNLNSILLEHCWKNMKCYQTNNLRHHRLDNYCYPLS